MDMAKSSMARNSQNISRSKSKVSAVHAKTPPDCQQTLDSSPRKTGARSNEDALNEFLSLVLSALMGGDALE